MRHEHLVVTVDSGTKARVEEDLDPGETVEAWVADAIDAKLATEQAEGSDAETQADDSDGPDDDYDEGFEYVDDCAI